MVTIDRIGVSLEHNELRAVGLRHGVAVWAGAAVNPVGLLEDALIALLSRSPAPRWRKTPVVVAVGPARCQLRRIAGLPPVRDASMVAAIVRENMARFFLRNGVPLVAAGAVQGQGDSWWSACFEALIVEAALNATRSGPFRLLGLVPLIAVLAEAAAGGELARSDGETHVRVRFEDGLLAEAARVARGEPRAEGQLPGELLPLGAEAAEFLPAFSAAAARLEVVPVCRPQTDPSHQAPSRGRLVLATSALIAGVVAALLAPPIGARIATSRAERELASHGERVAIAGRAVAELRHYDAALREYAALVERARPVTRIVAEVTRLAPDSSAVISLRLDSTGGQLVMLAPRIAALLERFERSDGFGAPQLVGPVTRERVAGRDLERATIRFTFR